MRIRVCRSKNAGVAGYAEAFRPVQSDSQTSEWYSYFENDVLVSEITFFSVCLCSEGVSYIGQAEDCGDQEKSGDQNDPPGTCH